MVNVKSRSENAIAVDIYSQRSETEDNVFYRYKSDEIEEATGVPSTELQGFVDDVFRGILIDQGVENFEIDLNPDVIPTKVDYLINDI